MKKLLYFAYGSNLLSQRLADRIGDADYFKNYKLQDYKLVFNCKGFANIEPSKGDFVEGCLYRLNAEQLSILNQHEALYCTEFLDYDKDTIIAVYIGIDLVVRYSIKNNIPPIKSYLQIIMMGMLQKGLKDSYQKVEAIFNSIPKPVIRIHNRPAKRIKRRR